MALQALTQQCLKALKTYGDILVEQGNDARESGLKMRYDDQTPKHAG
jgi:hypothetical protein